MKEHIPAQYFVRIHRLFKALELQIFEEMGISIELEVKNTAIVFSLPTVVATICRALGLTLEQLRASNRATKYKEARQICIYLTNKYMPGVYDARIAKYLNRDRSNVQHSINAVLDRIEIKDQEFTNKLYFVENEVIKMINEFTRIK